MSKTKTVTKPKAEKHKVELIFEPMVGMGGGFRQEWLSGEGNGIKFQLDSGAGLGNPLFTLSIQRKGKSYDYTADIRPMVKNLLSEIVATLEAA